MKVTLRESNQLIEKAVVACLDDSVGDYEEIDDDFIANMGEAMEPVEQIEEEDEEHPNEGVQLVKGEIETRLEAMRAMMAERGFMLGEAGLEQQKELDGDFDDVLQDYEEDIGDVEEEVEIENPAGDDELDAAIDEFIEETKFRFRKLH